jgi:hypothetical protein
MGGLSHLGSSYIRKAFHLTLSISVRDATDLWMGVG